MPLFVVRPSRGAWAFFGLVVLGVVGARAANRHEARVIQQDRPASETAHALASCVLGANTVWILRDPDEPEALRRWTLAAGNFLRAAVARPQPEAWPRRCVAHAARLHRSLTRASTSPIAARVLAQDVHNLLERAASDRDELVALTDSDQIPSRLAALMMQVHALSLGTRATWDRALLTAHAPPVTPAQVPRLRGLPNGIEQGVVAEAGRVYGRNAWDGMLHALELDATGLRDVVVGAAVPLREPARASLLRAWRDDGPVMVASGAVPRLLRMPRGFRVEGAVTDFRWDADVHGGQRALLTLDAGTVRVQATPSDGPVTWSDARGVGPGESALAAMIATDADAGADATSARWRVTVLRPRFSDAALEQFLVTASPAAPDENSSRPQPPVVSVSAAEALHAPAELPASVTQVETCRAGAVGYMLLATSDALTALRVEGHAVRAATVHTRMPRGARLSVSCDASRALAAPTPLTLQGGAALFHFDGYTGGRGVQLDHPPGGVTDLHALLLVRDAVLSVTSTPGAVRAWRRTTGLFGLRGGAAWEPAGMVMHLLPSSGVRRAVTRAQAQSRGDDVTLLFEYAEAPRLLQHASTDQPMSPFDERPATAWSPAGAAVVLSNDGGATFTSP